LDAVVELVAHTMVFKAKQGGLVSLQKVKSLKLQRECLSSCVNQEGQSDLMAIPIEAQNSALQTLYNAALPPPFLSRQYLQHIFDDVILDHLPVYEWLL
jgi:hypothetical protein